MLTIADASGLIAAAVMIVQYTLPAAFVVILVKYVGTESSAVTWSVVNRTISTTIWPHLFRADAVSTRCVSLSTNILSWTSTIGTALLIVSGVLAPIGLYDVIEPGGSKLVEFEYVKDSGPWGRVTMPRPNSKFSRHCELGLKINCPGQYQGVFMNETSPGRFQSQETDETSTVNLTIPLNFTAMFSSATSDRGNTMSGLFDIQYRFWKMDRWGVLDKGQPYVRGDFRDIESLITQDGILLKEGLVVDMREDPGIGFRNHTIPVELEHGGTWSEDITWIESATRCADTNLSIELRTENPVDDVSDDHKFFIVDRGAFVGLDKTALESRPWLDNQTLDLFSRAHKAARMHNVLVAASLNVSLPLDPPTKTVPKILVETTGLGEAMFNYQSSNSVVLGEISGVGGVTPKVPGYPMGNTSDFTGNTSALTGPDLAPYYPDQVRRLLALNYSAINQICMGYYEVSSVNLDGRASNITNPAVQCGSVLGAPLQNPKDNLSPSTYSGVETKQRNLYVCASGVRAAIKTVDFRYNGTGRRLSNLEVLRIKDKVYQDEESKPLWAVEHSSDKRMYFEPLWGIVDGRYETTDGFYTLRADKLWLPTNPHLTLNFGETTGMDALAAVTGFIRRLGNLYGGLSSLDGRDYTGKHEYALFERFQRLSRNETVASQIPSLILNDGLAASLVGTKTSVSTKYVGMPASLAVDNTVRGFPRAKVVTFERVLRYDMRYAIPALVVLAIWLFGIVGASITFLTSPSTFRTMQNMYNQIGTGRLVTNLLRPGRGDPKQPSREWVREMGWLPLSFGQISAPEKDHFCMVMDDGGPSDAGAGETGAGETEAKETGAGEAGAGEAGARETGAGETGVGETGAREAGAREAGAGEAEAGEAEAGEAGAREAGARETGAGEAGARETGAGEMGIRNCTVKEGGKARSKASYAN